MVLKNRVKEFLQEKGISAYQFIKDSGISETTGYELARNSNHLPSIASLVKICDTYGIQISEIVVWEKAMGNYRKQIKLKEVDPLTVKQALEDIERTIREALEVPDNAQIRRLKIDGGEYTGEITADGQNWFEFSVGEDGAEIFEA